MDDPEVATKAPESDAQEDIPITGDTPVQEVPKMGEHCVTDRPTPSGETQKGEIRKLGGVDVYISKPPSYPSSPSRLLLLLTGGTGLHSTNNQIQSDHFANEGFVVIMPDLFGGDPAPNSATHGNIPDAEREGGSILDTVKLKAVETAKSFVIDMWLARHTEDKVMPILHKVIEAAKSEFADAVAVGGGVYAVGYCFGGRYVLLLAADRSSGTPNQDLEAGLAAEGSPLIKAGALAHATLVSPDDFVALKAPVSLVCVESDPLFPDEVRAKGEDMMAQQELEHEVQVYPGVPHGFAVVGDYEEEHIRDAQETAYEQMLKWIKEH